jgi:quercetin dioxygenase-like cupin family protein
MNLQNSLHLSLFDALAKGPPPVGNLAIPVLTSKTLEVEVYAPQDQDRQQPHARDEIYIIARGAGQFFDGQKTCSVATGDFLFVPAGQEHRFSKFSEDFAVWVFFYDGA